MHLYLRHQYIKTKSPMSLFSSYDSLIVINLARLVKIEKDVYTVIGTAFSHVPR
jgi:hypothetical protein